MDQSHLEALFSEYVISFQWSGSPRQVELLEALHGQNYFPYERSLQRDCFIEIANNDIDHTNLPLKFWPHIYFCKTSNVAKWITFVKLFITLRQSDLSNDYYFEFTRLLQYFTDTNFEPPILTRKWDYIYALLQQDSYPDDSREDY